MTLYEINEQLNDLLENQFDATCLDPETGEINEVFFASKISDLSIDIECKMDNIACYIKNLAAESAALKAEEAALYKRRRAKEVKAESLKSYLCAFMELTWRKKYESARCALSTGKSESVFVENETLLLTDERFANHPKPTISKEAVKMAIKAGEKVPGACLITNTYLKIK